MGSSKLERPSREPGGRVQDIHESCIVETTGIATPWAFYPENSSFAVGACHERVRSSQNASPWNFPYGP